MASVTSLHSYTSVDPPQHAASEAPDQDDTSAVEIARIANGLAHPARVDIVQHLAHEGPKVNGDIVRWSGLAQSTVSEHLRVLRDAGIVSSHREGPRVWSCLVPGVLTGFTEHLDCVAAARKACPLDSATGSISTRQWSK